ncbi:MAG: capsid cement protein [Acidimicrobiia bacterium]
MAKNRVHLTGRYLSLAATQPATPVSGDPVLVINIPGVSLTAERADGTTSIQTDGVFNLSVRGETNAGAGSAVAIGDILYYDQPMGTPFLNKDTTGIRFGYALGTVTSATTATIPVKIGH